MATHVEDYAHLLSPATLAATLTKGNTEPWVAFRHHRMISRELVTLHARMPGAPRNLMVMCPPRHGKSELCSHWFPVWNLALDPSTNVILCSYALSLATKFSRSTRRSIREHYPMVGTRLLEDSRAAHRWETTDGGGLFAAGIGTGISGRGADVLILDDPVKDAEAADSKIIRDNTWDWYETTFLSRRAPDAIQVIIMTRWHEDDICGRLLEREPEDWQVLNLPALAEEDDPLGRAEDDPLWPEKFDLEFLDNWRQKRPRAFTALYQQRPTPAEGLAIERTWWRWYDPKTERPPIEAFDRILQSWDPTFKDLATSDFVGCLVLGVLGHKIYMLDGLREHLNAPKTVRAIRDMQKKWPAGKRILIEEAASGPAIIQMLERELPGITPVRAKGSKVVRLHWGVNSVAGFIEAGNFYLPRGHNVADELQNEAAQFPHGAHDDLVDALTQGCQMLIPKSWANLGRWGRELAEEKEGGTGFIEQHNIAVRKAIRKRVDLNLKNKEVGQDMPGWN